jgi:hypothetical protein
LQTDLPECSTLLEHLYLMLREFVTTVVGHTICGAGRNELPDMVGLGPQRGQQG